MALSQYNTYDLSGQDWFEDYADEIDESQIDEYDITATPNDFNVLTIFQFMESGVLKIPGFQRNYVWDINRASKLIESLIIGLPVPQIFLYEEAKNKFLVIDGQQRLMSVYYFLKQRFPKKEKRIELRQIFDQKGKIPDEVLFNDNYFEAFKLKLPAKLPDRPNKFHALNYATLGDYKTSIDLRPIRNVIVKQNSPQDDDSAVYEIFNRLNSGGVNLKPQEIRASLYHSDFYDSLQKMNTAEVWRQFLAKPEPDLHMKDVEMLLRCFAMLIDEKLYAPSLTRFLNQFSKKYKQQASDQNTYLESLFQSFLDKAQSLPKDAFLNKRSRRFNIALFEAVFVATASNAFDERRLIERDITVESIVNLERDPAFTNASQQGTTQTANVKIRLKRARDLILEK